ncbi:putative transcriptional regulatory protein [Sterolibacterium denitrificans]|uniref:Transcriptional regulatory protein n=1 Tax=Sterolibacterium denitrificans TaxID=157592 RepID=A0A7Z7MVP5_9PROT|nr:TetR/AcrR family transcriptional regulator [Sterolibacterium denitrificans]SMB28319.1 putative transcriptional regulatory protein [Sterolibacterium denitrificans]
MTLRPARVGRPRGSNKEAKLTQILLAARRQFAEKGYAQTTFKDVGRAVGMTHAALYSYFSSKLELYVATLVDAQSVLLPEYLRALEECPTLRERFRRILMASAAAADRDATVTGFLAAVPIEMRRHPELLAELLRQNNGLYQALNGMFEEAKRTGELNPALSTENLIAAFFGGALGVSLFHYGMHASTRLTDAMAIFATLVDQGFDIAGIGPAFAEVRSATVAGRPKRVGSRSKPAEAESG